MQKLLGVFQETDSIMADLSNETEKERSMKVKEKYSSVMERVQEHAIRVAYNEV